MPTRQAAGGARRTSQHTNQKTNQKSNQRTNQLTRTRRAIVDACRDLIRTGAVVTMPEVAQRALVSEATAYRYFPDLVSLLNEALVGLWPSPAEALEPVVRSNDPVERIAFASDVFLQRVLAYQGAVRAMIAATITRPELAAKRPGLRFAWIDEALAPAEATLGRADPEALKQLKRDLALVVSADALFTLTDLAGMLAQDAIASATRLATIITATALSQGLPAHGDGVS